MWYKYVHSTSMWLATFHNFMVEQFLVILYYN